MRRISFVFLTFLIFQVISIQYKEGFDIYIQDNIKCSNAMDDPSKLTASKCNEATPLLESKGFYKGECCKIKATSDPLFSLKRNYKDNWKKMAISIYHVDENISEEDLREVAIAKESDGPIEMCEILLDNPRQAYLYEIALTKVNKTLKYDCGSGEKTFNARNFIPKTEKEEIEKDLVDCHNANENYSEKRCFKQGNKLLSDNTQCCWCEFTEEGQTSPEGCMGTRIDQMKEFFTDYKKVLLSFDPKRKAKITCRCANNKNEMINVKFDTVSDDMTIN
jgi:hypothetical protein